MGKIIAVTNQKGGVGKTTTSVNLSASLAATKSKVLLIDMDPQGNAAMGCGIDKEQLEYSSCELLLGDVAAAKTIIKSKQLGFDIIPGNADLTAADIQLMSAISRERYLADALLPIQANYDYIFIDCPPALNMLTLNAMVAADSVLIPMQCEYYALEGLSALLSTIKSIQQKINPDLHLEGIVRTLFDNRSRLTKEVSAQLVDYFKEAVFKTCIPRNVRLAEAPSHGLPIIQYDRRSKGAVAYLAMADEMLNKQRSN